MAERKAEQGTATELGKAAVDHRRLLNHYQLDRYDRAEDAEITWVVSTPGDFIPSAPDLPGARESVRSKIPGKKLGETYWEYMCVLIALVKSDGYGTVQRLTGQQVGTLQPAIQALHDHYIDLGVQYDDSAARTHVMNDWGYKAIFSGQSTWADLPKHVELKRGGKYIFDIPGHTVQVDVLRDVPKDGKPLANPKQFLSPQSEKDNFDKDETLVAVNYIWSK